jgi:hypothetical protein
LVQVAAALQSKALALHDGFVKLDGSGVDYPGLAKSATTAAFVDTASRLAGMGMSLSSFIPKAPPRFDFDLPFSLFLSFVNARTNAHCSCSSACARSLTGALIAVPSSELAALGLDFWINLYNALVMHASVVLGHPTDKETRAAFFSGTSGGKYRLGGFDFSLDDIEHGVLRGSPQGDSRSFQDGDPRQFLAVAKVTAWGGVAGVDGGGGLYFLEPFLEV